MTIQLNVATLVPLSLGTGDTVYVNLGAVVYFKPTGSGGVRFEFTGLPGITVNESMETVVRLLNTSGAPTPENALETFSKSIGNSAASLFPINGNMRPLDPAL